MVVWLIVYEFQRHDKILIEFRSELGRSIMEVHGLVSGWGLSILSRLSSIVINVGCEEFNHITQGNTHQEGRNPEPEHGNSHWEVGDDGWDFVSDVEVLFVTDMIGSHLPD